MEFLANQAGKSDQDCEYIPLDHRARVGYGNLSDQAFSNSHEHFSSLGSLKMTGDWQLASSHANLYL
jgi:hypothetical protein